MQSTSLDNIRETNLSTSIETNRQENTSDTTKQPDNSDMQLIPQKSFKENENANNSCDSEAILPENRQSPSKSRTTCEASADHAISGAGADPETDASGKTDEQINESIALNEVCENLNLPESSAPSSITRPASMTSVTSSRTSRESGYFSSSSANESPQLQLQSNGIEITIDEDEHEEDENAARSTHIISVPEEKEEDLKSSREDLDQSSTNQSNDESLNTDKPINEKSSKQQASYNQLHVNQNHCETLTRHQVPKRHDRVSVKDINKKLGEIDHLAPTASMAMDASFQLTYVDRVILELIETERMYVRALEDILAGYDLAIKNTPGLPIKANDAKKLFGNIKDIYAFNRKFLSYLENCESDPVKVGHHFVSQDASFSVYTEYCTNYPISVAILTRCMKNPVLAHFFKTQQESLRHTLPLGAYLLKPVQRILKYHLILQEMVKNCDKNLENFSIIKQALATMTFIARHINDMKRKNEDAVHIQELQSLLTNWRGDDLTTYGKIVMEGDLKMQGAKNERLVFLFDKMILISKRREDGFIMYKTHIMCSDLILLESVKDNPLSFLIAPFDLQIHTNQHSSRGGSKQQHILTVHYPEEKKLWTQNIKRQILKNHHTAIPLQAQQSIMNMDKIKLDGPFSKNNKRAPTKLFGTTLAPSTLDSNGKIRRRKDSINRKTLPTRALKKKQENEIHHDAAVTETNSESNVATPSKSRFSIPWINKNSSPKHESTPPSNTASLTQNENTIKEEGEHNEEKKEQEKRFVKKRGRNANRRNDRHKQSIIYKRYKRRKSQPVITEMERMKKKDPESPKVEKVHVEKSNSDLSMDDFDSFEDFLCCTANNSHESVSWDVQIVEAVFERFKKKKDEENKDGDLPEQKANSSPFTIPTIEKLKDSSDVSDTEESQKLIRYDSTETFLSESVDELTPAEDLVSADDNSYSQAPQVSPRNGFKEVSKEEEEEDLILSIDVPATPTLKSAPWSKDFEETPSPVVVPELNDVIVHSAEESEVDEDDVTKDDVNEISYPESPSAAIKRSHSAQSSYTDRRKYFEKLKEIRDRRHSNVSLNSYDANQIIQTGKVQEMIAHHRDYVASQVRGSTSYQNSPEVIGEIPSENMLAPPNNRRYRRQKSSVTSETSQCENLSRHSSYTPMDMDTVQNSHFSAMTTGSLPLNFTSSSNSSSNSSINDAEEHHPDCTSPTTPKYKVLLQPRLFLWRSYFEDNGANTRRSSNLAIQTPSEATQINKDEVPPKIPLREVVNLATTKEDNRDELSEEVDDVWEDFETKAKKFESLCRSSSSEKIYEKQPLKRSSFSTRKDLAAAPSIKEDPTSTSFKQSQDKWKKDQPTGTNQNQIVKTNRLRFNSKRNSTSETETCTTTTTPHNTAKRSSSFRSATSNKTSTSIATTPLRFNTNTTESTPVAMTTVRRSSSYKSKNPVPLPFDRSQSPVAVAISRHNSMTSRDRSSPTPGALSDSLGSNLSRSSSYRKSNESLSAAVSTNGSLLRRNSSRVRKNNSSNPDLATVSSTATTPTPEAHSTLATSSTPELPTEEVPPADVDGPSEAPEVDSAETNRIEEVTEQCSGKSVLKLAQRFDQIALISGNSSLLTGRNRWNKGRKHHSDLALPSSSEVLREQNEVATTKKHRLKRHQSCITTKTLFNRDLPLARRFSEAQFSEATSQKFPASVSSSSGEAATKQSLFLNSPKSPPPAKPLPPLPHKTALTRARSQDVITLKPPPPTKVSARQPSRTDYSIQSQPNESSDPKTPPLPSSNKDLLQTNNKGENTVSDHSVTTKRTRRKTRLSNVSDSSVSDATPASPPPTESTSDSKSSATSQPPTIQSPKSPPPQSFSESKNSVVNHSLTVQNPKSSPSQHVPEPKSPIANHRSATETPISPSAEIKDSETLKQLEGSQTNTHRTTNSAKPSTRARVRARNRKTADNYNSGSFASPIEPKDTKNSQIRNSGPVSTDTLSSATRTRARGRRSRRKTNPPPHLETTQNSSITSKPIDHVPSFSSDLNSQSSPITSPVAKVSQSTSPNNTPEDLLQSTSTTPSKTVATVSASSNKNAASEVEKKDDEDASSHDELESFCSPPLSPKMREFRNNKLSDHSASSLVQSLCKTSRLTESKVDETSSDTHIVRPPTPVFRTRKESTVGNKTNSKSTKPPPSDFIALFCKI